MRASRRLALPLLQALALAAPLGAQVPLPPLVVPKGLVRFDVGSRFDMWDRRYRNGVKEDAGADFTRDPATGSWLPALGAIEADLRQITGLPALSLSLGATRATVSANTVTPTFGAAYGLTSRLTLFGKVPLVRVRVQSQVLLDSTHATAGANPASDLFPSTDRLGDATKFLDQLSAAMSTLDERIRSGFYAGDPAALTLAQSTLAQGQAIDRLIRTAPFLPIETTTQGVALITSVNAVRANLNSAALGVPGFTANPALPTDGLGRTAIEDFATNPDGPIAGEPFEVPVYRAIGDIEVGAAFEWLRHQPAAGGMALRSVLSGTVRLRTGRLDTPSSFFDLATGDRQPDVQADLVTDVMDGPFGGRLTASYVLQLPGDARRRVTPPDQPLAAAATLAGVERNPGEIVEGAIEPFVRLAPGFAIVGGARYWSKAADTYKYVTGQTPIEGASLDALAQDSKENGLALGAGLSFARAASSSGGKPRLPMDATLRWEMVARSTLGRVPARQTVSFQIRLYRKLF